MLILEIHQSCKNTWMYNVGRHSKLFERIVVITRKQYQLYHWKEVERIQKDCLLSLYEDTVI